MIVDRTRARHRQADLAADRRGLGVEVVEHLDVVADEADRADHRRVDAAGARVAQVVADVRAEPRIFRAAAAALIDGRARSGRAGARDARSATSRAVASNCAAYG